MAICMVASAVARIAINGLKGSDDSLYVWCQIILPTVATLLYVVIALFTGKEMFYKTALPVWMVAIYSGIWISSNIPNTMMDWLFWIALIFFAFMYQEITDGRYNALLLVPVVGSPILFILYYSRVPLLEQNWKELLPVVPDLLMLLGAFLLIFAIRVHTDGKYHPTWGDRSDGRRLRTLPPMAMMSPYLMWTRNASSNYFEEAIEITNVDRYIRQKRREGLTDFGITHVLLAAYVRGVAKYPGLNRFLAGQRVYSRGEDIQYCMVIKKEMSVDSPDTAIKVHLSPRDTAEDVYRKLNAAVDSVKATTDLDSSYDQFVQLLSLIPGVVMRLVVLLLRFLDYFGLLPKFIMELSPFHGSLFYTSMGSLGIKPIYHHLYDFGNLPVFGAFGLKRKALEVQEDGSVVQKKYIDIKFVLDERIVDGFYYAAFFKYFRRLMAHPEVLDNPPAEVVRDID